MTQLFIIKAMSCLCALEKFEIKGRDANYTEFGIQGDIDPDEAEPYGCGNMVFKRF